MRRILLAALIAAPSSASAHIMPEGQGSTRLVGNKGYTLLSISAKSLASFDDDRDGLIGRDELARHADAIDAMLRKRVRLYSGGELARIAWQTLSVEHSDTPGAPMSAITLVRISEWNQAPKDLRVVSDLGAQVEFRAILGERTEIDTLSARRGAVTFFRPPSAFQGLDLVLATALLAVLSGVIFINARAKQPASPSPAGVQRG